MQYFVLMHVPLIEIPSQTYGFRERNFYDYSIWLHISQRDYSMILYTEMFHTHLCIRNLSLPRAGVTYC